MFYFCFIFAVLFLLKTYSFGLLHKNKKIHQTLFNSATFLGYILLQQIVLFLFWTITKIYFSSPVQIIIIALLFSIFHLHFFVTHRKIDGYLLSVSSLFGGAIFTYLYIYTANGFYIAFLVHILFHILLDLLFVKCGGKPMKNYRKNP